jgi:hypothetical protein
MSRDNHLLAKLYKVGLFSAVLSAICWMIYIWGGTGNPDLRIIEDPETFFHAIQNARISYLMYGWGGIFGTLLVIPYLVAFYTSVKEKSSLGLIVLVISLVGIVLAMIGFMKPLTLVYLIRPIGLNADPEFVKTMQIAVLVMGEVVEVGWFIGSFLVFGLGIGLFAFLALKLSIGPKWINVIGTIGGISGVIWLAIFFPFLETFGTLLRLFNILTIFIWSIGLSAALTRLKLE